MKSAPVCLIALGLGTVPVFADVRVSNLFGDNIVLQREIAAPVWGTANPGEAVTVKIGEARATGRADAKGNWFVNLPAMKANSKAQDMAITGENTLTIRNVLVGDVWVCAGQSNMEMPLGNCDAPQDIAAANYPALRWIKPSKHSLGWPGTEVVGRWGMLRSRQCADNDGSGLLLRPPHPEGNRVALGFDRYQLERLGHRAMDAGVRF